MSHGEVSLQLVLDANVSALLADNSVDLIEELRNKGFAVRHGDAVAGPVSFQPGGKDIALAIVIATIYVPAVTSAVCRIIQTLRSAPVKVEQRTLEPVAAPDGSVVSDAQGNPVLYWRTVSTFIEPITSHKQASRTELTVGDGDMLSVKFDTES